jgi:hypothetical protein
MGCCGFRTLCTQCLQVLVKAVMPVGPDLLVARDPADRDIKPFGIEGARPGLRRSAPGDQMRALEDFQVLGDRLLGHVKRLGELNDRRVALSEPLQDRPTGGICKGREEQAQVVIENVHGSTIATTERLHN